MNIAKFVVLGALDQISPASGYDIIRELNKKMITHWTNVKKGSIYHALKSLAKTGEIRETEKLKHGSFPTMTLYEITEKGRNFFDCMQAESFLGLYPYYFGFKLALKFNSRQTSSQIKDFADQAIKIINQHIVGRDMYIAENRSSDPELEETAFFVEHDKMLLNQEKKWIKMAVKRLPKK